MRNRFLPAFLFFNFYFLIGFSQGNLLWSTYCGGSDEEIANSVATDASGNVYVAGQTKSPNAIASGGFQNTYGGNIDAYLVKYDASGNRLWGTYYGGIMGDVGNSVAVDGAGNVYLAGYTAGSISTTAGAFQTTYNGNGDAFLVKFDASGNCLWATYYGGTGIEYGWVVTTDPSGNVFLVGYTGSTNAIASAGAFQTTFSGGYDDAFIVKFDSNGNRLWSTYYGGTNDDKGTDVATDASGNVYMSGTTFSNSGIATAGGFQNTMGSSQDSYLVKFDSNGNRMWATYYGGANAEQGEGVATDPTGNVFISGTTASTTGISSGGFQNNFGGGAGAGDSYLVKFNSAGNRLWATYYGGANTEEHCNVDTDPFGNVYLAGETYSDNIGNCIAINGFQNSLIGAFQPWNIENTYLAKFDASGNRLCATYFGQQHEEYGIAAVDGSTGNVYLTAYTSSPSGIASGGFQNTLGGSTDTYLAKFSPCATPVTVTAVSTNVSCFGQCNGTGTATASNGTSPYTYSWSPGGATTSAVSGLCAGNYTVTVTDALNSTATATITVTEPTALTATITSTAGTCSTAGTASIVASGGTPAYSYSWSGGQTTQSVTGLIAGDYTATVTDAHGCTTTQTVTVISSGSITATVTNDTICAGQTATLSASGGTNYAWSDGSTASVINVSPSATTTYSVVVSSGSCADTANAIVVVNSTSTASASPNVTITAGNSTTLSASGGGTYTWSNGSVDSVITVSPLVTTGFCVTVNNGSCTDTACVTVVVEPVDCSTAGEFFLPTAFSPNGDGQNEVFRILYGNLDCIKEYQLIIYNRWGEKVFETDDAKTGWDGNYNGKAEDTAVFAFYMKVTPVSGKEFVRKGNVSLLR